MKFSLRLLLLGIAMMMFELSVRAGNITEEQARAKALSFLQARHSLPSGKRLAPAHTANKLQGITTGTAAFYVFNVGEQDGFVIVAGDDRVRSILGYADSGSFDANHAPAALNEMLAIYARQIEMIGQAGTKPDSVARTKRAPRRISGTMADVTPLLTTTWDQGDPYNAYCPTLNDQTALTGCVATAMAQIAYYHKFPTSQVPNLVAYTSATNKINVSAWSATTFDWDNMLDSYAASYTNAQKAAVATLMRYCGQAAQMDYGFTSGAYNGDALYAFKEKLGYNANAEFRSAASYSANGWEDLIYKEVSEGRPVYYSALNGDVGCDVSGHAFVIDGYQADGNYFHVNWGWGGAADGYFNLFALDPGAPESSVTSTGWHYQMLAIIGLSPETVNTAKLVKDASGSWLITSTDDWNELSANLEAYNGGSFKLTQDISVTTMVGTDWQPFSGTFDGQGHTLTVNIESGDEYAAPFHWAIGCTFKNLTVAGTITVTEHFAGGLIGWAEDVTLQGCESKVTINSNYNGDGTHGGFISIVRGSTARFYDCVFSGIIIGENTYSCGGFCGWRDGDVEIYNCLNIGSFELDLSDCATFSRNGAEPVNSYYISSSAVGNQGKSATPEQLADGSIAHALQNGSRDWTTGQVWGQQLGTDAVPVLTSDTDKGVYKVSFSVGGQVLKTVFCNGTIGDKMPEGEEFGLANATFTSNGSTFTSNTPITGDITVNVTGTAAYALTLGTPANGTISINNTTCVPGLLKKVTATPANGYVVSAVTVTDAKGMALPVTPVSNNANEFVFAFPKSSVTVNAEFTRGEAEPTRFINSGMTLPASWRNGEQPWTADTWTTWGGVCDGDVVFVDTPPTDALGHQWYEEGYALTNSDVDVMPNGQISVWENHTASFGQDRNYDYFRAHGLEEERMGDFYIRRIFTFNTENVPTKLYLSCNYDGTPAEFYINGTQVYADHRLHEWRPDEFSVELTPNQIALIYTDGTPNVLAAHAAQDWGDYFLDCGLYDPTAISYEVTSENTVRVQRNQFFIGDVVIPETVTYNGVTYTVTELADDVFNYCYYGITSVSLPPTLTNLANNIFWDCDVQYVKSYVPIYQVEEDMDVYDLVTAPVDATEYEVSMGCTRIWSNAFKFTDKLQTLTLPRSLTYIGYTVFTGCTALKDIYAYARPVPYTEWNAFEGIDKSKITVHVYASALESYKQSWGEEFNYVTMPDPQTITLAINVANASSLRTLIEEAAAAKGSTMYDVTGITVTGIINQDDLWTLSEMCTGVYSLTTIDLSGTTIEGNYIGDSMFRDREKLTSIILPETLEYIGDASFYNCDGLTAIDIPASVKRIWSTAFAECNNLVTVTGLEGLSAEDSYGAWDPFWGTAITQPVYGGKVFLYMPPSIVGDYEMPTGITMTVAGSIRQSQLSSITLPASLSVLGDDTFQDCPNLIDIYCYATTPPICYSGVWENGFDRGACTIHVPASAVEDYQNADEWRDMGRIVSIVTGDLVDMTIQVATAGTLNDALFDAAVAQAQISDKTLIRNLTVTGNLNADDIAYLNTLPYTLYNMSMLDLSGTTLAGNTITELMFYATSYKTIKLPANVTSIANEAFRDSRRLREVTLPASLKAIGVYAFAGSALNGITIPEGVTTIEEGTFDACSALTSINIPESVTRINCYAFRNCKSLTSITIPDGVTEMEHRALQGCSALKSITLGNGITYIPECWAEFCNNLEEVIIDKCVREIHWRAFPGFSIKHVYCYAKNPPSWDDAFYDGINANAVLHVYSNCLNRYKNAGGWKDFPTIVGDLGSYPSCDIAVNVTTMGSFNEAFPTAMTAAGCKDLMDIGKITVTGNINNDDLYYLRDNLGAWIEMLDLSAATVENNTINEYALYGCMFNDLKLPANLERIGRHALTRTGLTSITFPDSVIEMGDRLLQDCGALTSITFGKEMTYIPERVAEGCNKLEEVTIGKKVSDVWWYAFPGINIKHVNCHAKNPPSWNDSFYDDIKSEAVLHVYSNSVNRYKNINGWKKFTNIVGDLGEYPSYDIVVNVETMGTFSETLEVAMSKTGCEDMTYINKLTVTGNINRWDLEYIRNNMGTSLVSLDLGAVTMEDNYTGDNALADCGFDELILPANLVYLGGWNPLSHCSNLKTLHIPNSVRTAGAGLLNGATSLETVTGGNGVVEIDRGNSYFSDCNNLKSIVILNKFLFRAPGNIEGTYEVPENVTTITCDAFVNCSKLTEIKLPASLEFIGSYAFARTGLTSITIPNSVTEISDRALQSCSSLTSITLGNGIAYIPECLAEYCDNLKELTVGKGVASIGWRAFRGSNLKHVYCLAKNPPSCNEAFYDGFNANAVLHVYSNCVELYKNADGWKDFPTIVGDLGTYPSYELAVNVQTLGTFSEALQTAMTAIGCEDKLDISKLTVTGNINNDDLYYIRDRMGATLDALDLSAVKVDGNTLGHEALARCRFKELVLPNTIVMLQGWHVLEGCINLKSIDIPSSVTYVGPRTLYGATSLETVTGGNGVTGMEWGDGMYFDNCPNLKSSVILGSIMFRLPMRTQGSYEMPDYVTTIARDAMWNVTGLTTLTLPESITTILGNSFAGNNNLKDIYFYAIELPNTDWEAFNGFDRTNCTLHVYEEMVEVFQNDEIWSEFNIVGDLGAMPIRKPINEADYADLCAIFNTLGGNSWRTKWLTNKNLQTISRWRGVTFDEDGYVTSIELGDNGLSGDISSLTFTGLTRLTSLIMSNNALSGDIMSFKANLPAQCWLNVERQNLGYVGEHTLYELCNYGELPSIAYYRSESGSLASTLMGVGGICQFYHEGTDGGHNWEGHINANGETWNNSHFYWSSPTTVECIYPHRFSFTYKYEMGDANMDDALNVLDLQSTLNFSNNQLWGLFNFHAADTYGQDDEINVQDIVATVNILLAQESNSPAHVRAYATAVAGILQSPTEGEAYVSVENGEIVLYTVKPVAALDLRLAGIDPNAFNWNTEDMGFATAAMAQANGTHAIIYSMQPREIEVGRTVLATFDAGLSPRLTSAVLSDSQAHPVSVGQTMPTGIRLMTSPEEEERIYNLAGQRMIKTQKGINIVNGKKVITK